MAGAGKRGQGGGRPGANRPQQGRAQPGRAPQGRAPQGRAQANRQTQNQQQSGPRAKGGTVSEPAGPEDPKSASKRLFDLRWLIAAMFAVYGVVLIITGIFDNAAEVAKAAGVRINLWTGIGMFLTAVVFAVWARLRPLRDE